MFSRIIFHIDMDAFFASIEQRDNPDYRGKPLIVGAKPGTRGVVSAASYEARRFGIHSAMPISEAVRRCPAGIFVRPRMEAYEHESQEVMRILGSFSPVVEQVSIDEAFLDMTGTEKLLGTSLQAAKNIAASIQKELAITASIGIAPNKFCAKIASDLNKPNGIAESPVEETAIIEWLAPMPAGRVWGIGKKTNAVLSRMGVNTIGDLQKVSQEVLVERFGKQGEELYALCRGIDDRPVAEERETRSISREHTFNEDSPDREAWKRVIFSLAQDVARSARSAGLKGSTVVLIYRKTDFSKHTKRKPLAYPTNVAKFIYEGALDLLGGVHEKALRLIGVGLTGLDEQVQTDLFAQERTAKALEVSETTVDLIVKRFGPTAIAKAREIKPAKHIENNIQKGLQCPK
jgi:nucleotidyltransferase/DNA polymerase involved in DNA repair